MENMEKKTRNRLVVRTADSKFYTLEFYCLLNGLVYKNIRRRKMIDGRFKGMTEGDKVIFLNTHTREPMQVSS